MSSDKEETGKSLDPSTASQNARERRLEDEVRASDMIMNAEVLPTEAPTWGDPLPARSLQALAHSLNCMAERAAEVGLHGNTDIARRAAGFIANVEKSVTRLLPKGQLVHHRTFDLDGAVEALTLTERGDVALHIAAGDGFATAWRLSDVEPVYELVAEGFVGSDGGPDPLRSLEPSGDLWWIGEKGEVEIIGKVHHLSVDPDQEVHIHHPAFGQAAEMAGPPLDNWPPSPIEIMQTRVVLALLLATIVVAVLLMVAHR